MAPRALLLVLLAVSSIQFGAAIAATLFDEAGFGGTVFLRVAFAAVLLALLWRPALRGHDRGQWLLIASFGLALAGMNFFFYASLDRIPLGLAVTFEFVGPLGVALAGSRRVTDLLWVGCAGLGIVLIALPGTGSLDPIGVLYALVAGAFWAAYILLSARTGRAFAGGSGLALAMCVAGVLLVPAGVIDGGAALLEGHVLVVGAVVAVLSSAIPYSAEFEALRLLPEHVFGVLLSLEPAVAAVAGYLVLEQALATGELLGIALVMAATAGAVAGTRSPVPRDA